MNCACNRYITCQECRSAYKEMVLREKRISKNTIDEETTHYLITEEDINCLFGYFQAALDGEESKLSLKRLFDLQCSLIRSHPFSDAELRDIPTLHDKERYMQGYRAGMLKLKKERERVLDKLTQKLLKQMIIDGTTEFIKFPRHAISNSIESLRSEP